MFNSLVLGMNSLINFFYKLTQSVGVPSYALAIILFTIAIKVILYPLTVKQMKSMKAMQVLQPKMKEIQEKYKDDPQKAQEKMMALYKEHGANPLSGCLPLLLQMPILFALFSALREFKYINVEHAHFLYVNLSDKDPYYILPVVAGLATYVQQKVTTTNIEDPTQRTMLYFMPLMFVYFASNMPAGLVLYWVVFTVLGVVQQLFINRQSVTLKEEPVRDEKVRKSR